MDLLIAVSICAITVVVILLPITLRLAHPLRGALNAYVAERKITCEERRQALRLREAVLDQRIEAEQAGFHAQTVRYQTEAEVAQRTVSVAAKGQEQVLAARAQAEIHLAQRYAISQWPASPERTLALQVEAYKAYCAAFPGEVITFAEWSSPQPT